MEFRRANANDTGAIMDIFRKAQENFRLKGINQWQNGYPNTGVIAEDIRKGAACVITIDEKVAATVTILFDGEPTYSSIKGRWLTEGAYAVLHRIAVDAELQRKGIASELLYKAELLCREKGVPSIRLDTHEMNSAMRRLAEKCGFTYCGEIRLLDGSPRMAFEKLIK